MFKLISNSMSIHSNIPYLSRSRFDTLQITLVGITYITFASWLHWVHARLHVQPVGYLQPDKGYL